MNPNLISAIVYVARKLHWSRKEIGDLEPHQFAQIVSELSRQEAQEEYNENYRTASILAAIYNSIPRKSHRIFSPKDFLPDRETGVMPKAKLEKLAAEEDIILPKYKQED